MKSSYTKPMMAVEMFSATETTPRDCADYIPQDQVTRSNIEDCYWDLGGGAWVFSLEHKCNMDGEIMDFACYNNPSEDAFMFRS